VTKVYSLLPVLRPCCFLFASAVTVPLLYVLPYWTRLTRYFRALAYACITTPNHFTTNVAPSLSYTHTFTHVSVRNNLTRNRSSAIDW